jgi:hypothetical protein
VDNDLKRGERCGSPVNIAVVGRIDLLYLLWLASFRGIKTLANRCRNEGKELVFNWLASFRGIKTLANRCRNEGKELVFNLVPFECGRRIMGHGDGKL